MIFLEYHSSHPLKFSVPISLLFVCNNNHLLHLLLFVHIHLDLSFTPPYLRLSCHSSYPTSALTFTVRYLDSHYMQA